MEFYNSFKDFYNLCTMTVQIANYFEIFFVSLPLYNPENPSFDTVFFKQSHVPEYKGISFGLGFG